MLLDKELNKHERDQHFCMKRRSKPDSLWRYYWAGIEWCLQARIFQSRLKAIWRWREFVPTRSRRETCVNPRKHKPLHNTNRLLSETFLLRRSITLQTDQLIMKVEIIIGPLSLHYKANYKAFRKGGESTVNKL